MFDEADRNNLEGWHLDKKVPISIVITLIVQTVVAIYIGTTWKTEIDYRLMNVERHIEERRSQESRIITMEQQLRYLVDSMRRIEALLDNRRNGNSNETSSP